MTDAEEQLAWERGEGSSPLVQRCSSVIEEAELIWMSWYQKKQKKQKIYKIS